jgi:endonuclease/exonuclease/phosphatase family metal-dependent hydrolase
LPELSVASFNAHWGLTTDRRPFDVVEVCERLDTDVIVLQEVWSPPGERSFAVEAADQLGYKVHETSLGDAMLHPRTRVLRHGGPNTGSWGVAVLTRFPSVVTERVALPHTPGDPARRAGLRVDAEVAGVPFVIVGCHLTHRLYGSLRHLRRLREALSAVDGPAAALGDMNMWGPVVAGCLPGWRRAVEGRTWPAHHPHSQIDHIMVNARVDIVGGEVLGEVGSDHRPVRATLRVH